MEEKLAVNVNNNFLDRTFFLNKIEEEISAVENELHQNFTTIDELAHKISDIRHTIRNRRDPEYLALYKEKERLSHRNITLKRQLAKLGEEYRRYSTMKF